MMNWMNDLRRIWAFCTSLSLCGLMGISAHASSLMRISTEVSGIASHVVQSESAPSILAFINKLLSNPTLRANPSGALDDLNFLQNAYPLLTQDEVLIFMRHVPQEALMDAAQTLGFHETQLIEIAHTNRLVSLLPEHDSLQSRLSHVHDSREILNIAKITLRRLNACRAAISNAPEGKFTPSEIVNTQADMARIGTLLSSKVVPLRQPKKGDLSFSTRGDLKNVDLNREVELVWRNIERIYQYSNESIHRRYINLDADDVTIIDLPSIEVNSIQELAPQLILNSSELDLVQKGFVLSLEVGPPLEARAKGDRWHAHFYLFADRKGFHVGLFNVTTPKNDLHAFGFIFKILEEGARINAQAMGLDQGVCNGFVIGNPKIIRVFKRKGFKVFAKDEDGLVDMEKFIPVNTGL